MNYNDLYATHVRVYTGPAICKTRKYMRENERAQ